jgi:hypothetical protein
MAAASAANHPSTPDNASDDIPNAAAQPAAQPKAARSRKGAAGSSYTAGKKAGKKASKGGNSTAAGATGTAAGTARDTAALSNAADRAIRDTADHATDHANSAPIDLACSEDDEALSSLPSSPLPVATFEADIQATLMKGLEAVSAMGVPKPPDKRVVARKPAVGRTPVTLSQDKAEQIRERKMQYMRDKRQV